MELSGIQMEQNEDQLQEAVILLHEIFVSRTDHRGVILKANETFFRIAEYEEDEVIGKAHNIVRHSSMPKSIFKLFWERIKAKKMICAYVKNRTNSGKFYWVFATVFIEENSFFSIRIKPQSKYLAEMEALYRQLIQLEQEQGVEIAGQYLKKYLKDQGFDDYQQLMEVFLREESAQRVQVESQEKIFKLTKVDVRNQQDPNKMRLYQVLNNQQNIYKGLVNIVRLVQKNNFNEFSKKINFKSLADICEKFEVLAFNMCIASNKLGTEGAALYVVANTLQQATSKLVKNFEQFKIEFISILQEAREVELGLYYSMLQTEMIKYDLFLYHQNEKNINDFISGSNYLIDASMLFFRESSMRQHNFCKKLEQLSRTLKTLFRYTIRIELIKTGGSIEAAREQQLCILFNPYLEQLEQIIQQFKSPIQEAGDFIAEFTGQMSAVYTALNNVDYVLHESFSTEKKNSDTGGHEELIGLVA